MLMGKEEKGKPRDREVREEDNIGITALKSDFPEWYSQVVLKSGMADYAPTAGCMIIRPYGYAMWEGIQEFFNSLIKKTGHMNAYFPLFIPESFLLRESEHFEGFTPEVAWIHAEGPVEYCCRKCSGKVGKDDIKCKNCGADLEGSGRQIRMECPVGSERYALRPTSETIMYDSYSKWIRSWRDLPVLINQWCNVVRWETKATKLFLRTREFLWQEGHTAHADKDGADREVLAILEFYRQVIEDLLAIPVITGKKSENEKFPGALYTTTLESLMPDGKALQMGTSHNLGQNFAKAFGIMFRDRDEKEKHVWQTSWGISTRLLGAVVMAHGDNKGLVLPPRLAPVQVVIVPILFSGSKGKVAREAERIRKKLSGSFRTEVDMREGYSPGWKFNDWEMRGVPVRLEIGPRDLAGKQVVAVRRDSGKKSIIRTGSLEKQLGLMFSDIQKGLYMKAKKRMSDNTVEVKSFDGFMKQIEKKKMVRAAFCGEPACEESIKEKTAATNRVIPLRSGTKYV